MQRLHRRGGHPPCARNARAGRHHPHPAPYIVPSHRNWFSSTRTSPTRRTSPSASTTGSRGCVVNMDVELLEELSDIDHVVAIKNSTPDFRHVPASAYRLRHKVRYFNMPTSALGADLAALGVGDGLMGAGGVLGADHPDFWRRIAAGDSSRRGHAGRARPGHHESLVQQGLRRQLRQRPGHPQDSAAPARRSGRPCTASAADLRARLKSSGCAPRSKVSASRPRPDPA